MDSKAHKAAFGAFRPRWVLSHLRKADIGLGSLENVPAGVVSYPLQLRRLWGVDFLIEHEGLPSPEDLEEWGPVLDWVKLNLSPDRDSYKESVRAVKNLAQKTKIDVEISVSPENFNSGYQLAARLKDINNTTVRLVPVRDLKNYSIHHLDVLHNQTRLFTPARVAKPPERPLSSTRQSLWHRLRGKA